VLTCDAHFKELPAVVFHPKCPAPRRSLPAACEPHGHWDGWPKSRSAASKRKQGAHRPLVQLIATAMLIPTRSSRAACSTRRR
jgi:hypothetical protein